jgi:RND superfamily putative drug exporter
MFEKIGRFSSKYRYPIFAVWGFLLAVVLIFAPSFSDVVTSDQSSYLPSDEPSVVAARVAAEYFPEQVPPSQAVLVITSTNGSMRDEANQTFLTELTDWLVHELPIEAVSTVLSPTDPNLAERLISDDGQVAMIFVGLRGSVEDKSTLDALDTMQSRLDQAPAGVTGYVTGSVAIFDEYKSSALESADRTTVITVALVILILLIIYRSPISSIVPLVTIGVAFIVSRGLVAWLTTFGLSVSSITEVFLVVLLFGAGTDYCLFLVSRFREYITDGLAGPESARHTVSRVGETITSSAGTVVVGMVALSFAEMGLFASSGPSLALGVAVALLAGLTLTPALLAVMGKWAFWPGGARHVAYGGWWGKLAHWITACPWLPLTLALIVLLPLAIYGQGQQRNFDLLSDLPETVPSKAGFQILSESFGAGEMQPLDVILTKVPEAHSPAGLAYVSALTQRLLDIEGVADVRSLTLPGGKDEPELGDALRVESQLNQMVTTIQTLRQQAADPSALAGMDTSEMTAGFETLRAYLEALAAAFPEMTADAGYSAAVTALDGLESAVQESLQRLLVSRQLAETADGIAGALDGQAEIGATSAEELSQATAQFSTLRDCLAGMAQAHPALATLDGYTDTVAALDGIEATLTEIQGALLVSAQLDLLSASLAQTATALQEPAALASLAASPDQLASMATLDAYLQALAVAHPWLTEQVTFQSATAHLVAVQATAGEMAQALLVSQQLALISWQMDDMAQALEENPLSLMPQPGEPTAEEQMAALQTYLEELAAAYPSLAATEDFQTAMTVVGEMRASLETIDLTQAAQIIEDVKTYLAILSPALEGLAATAVETLPEATFIPQTIPGSLSNMLPDLSALADELSAAAADFAALAETARQERPQATFIPETTLPGVEAIPDPLPALQTDLSNLVAALQRLSAAAAVELPAATYLPPEELMAGEANAITEPLIAQVDALQTALVALADDFATRADGYFLPLALGEQATQGLGYLLETYSSSNGDAVRLQVVLAGDPFSPAAMDTVARLRDEVSRASTGYVSGSSAVNLDLRQVMDRDFVRVMVLVIGGILVVLVLLLRSLVAPLYMMATILLSYGATLGITRLVFDGIFGEGITWFAPFLIFVVLVALGMDYNIFLMGRVKEEVAGNGTRAGIERAVERTGGIITSAGIIMAGTFGAMMSSSLLGLVQVAFAVTVGILLDTFIIRTTIVPAIAVLLDKWNWWPDKGPGK